MSVKNQKKSDRGKIAEKLKEARNLSGLSLSLIHI